MSANCDNGSEIRRYLDLRVDEIKLKTVDGLSVVLIILRKRLFRDLFVKLFISIFYER